MRFPPYFTIPPRLVKMDNSNSYSDGPDFWISRGILDNEFSIDDCPMYTPVLGGSSPVHVSERPSPYPENIWTPTRDPIEEQDLVGLAPISSLPATRTGNQLPKGEVDQSRTAVRKPKAKTLRPTDWEPFKDLIVNLHIRQKKPLPEVRDIMMHNHGFDATLRQYRGRISKWGLNKNVQSAEMLYIARKQMKRKLDNPEKREYRFRARGVEVPNEKVERYKRRTGFIIGPVPQTPGGLSHSTISGPGSLTGSPASHCNTSTPFSVLGPDDHSTSPGMIQSIERLSGLLHQEDRTMNTYSDINEQAESIMHDLQVILEFGRKQDTTILRMLDTLPSSRTGQEELDYRMRRFLRCFGQTELCLNQGGKSQNFKYPRNAAIQQSRLCSKINIGVGELSLIFNKRIRSLTNTNDESNGQNKSDLTDYLMTISFVPDQSQRFHMLVASTLQQEIFKGTVSSISRLAVNRVLPLGSRVFQLVEEGRMVEFQEMLREGEASLRDHDEYGASLLFYSMRQPELCKYLLENGLYLDHVANCRGVNAWSGAWLEPALQIYVNDYEIEADELLRINRCRKMLLEAGADPTISMNEEFEPFIFSVIISGVPDSIRQAWNTDVTGCFADINEYKDKYSQSALLHHCYNVEADYSKECFDELLSLGANIHVRNPDGQTCLHKCIDHSGYTFDCPWNLFDDSWIIREHEALQFLIQRGADPRATDYSGESVSHLAYTTPTWYNVGSYLGDLWDSVLQSCGYEIAEFRSTAMCPREAEYTDEYTRWHFEQLWKGRECFCPYWDDGPWPLQCSCEALN